MTTPPLRDAEHKRLDAKLTGLLVITGINLLLLIAAWIGIIDLATCDHRPGGGVLHRARPRVGHRPGDTPLQRIGLPVLPSKVVGSWPEVTAPRLPSLAGGGALHMRGYGHKRRPGPQKSPV